MKNSLRRPLYVRPPSHCYHLEHGQLASEAGGGGFRRLLEASTILVCKTPRESGYASDWRHDRCQRMQMQLRGNRRRYHRSPIASERYLLAPNQIRAPALRRDIASWRFLRSPSSFRTPPGCLLQALTYLMEATPHPMTGSRMVIGGKIRRSGPAQASGGTKGSALLLFSLRHAIRLLP